MFDAQLPYQIKYTTEVPVMTGPLWYSIDLSACVGLAVVELAVSGLNEFWAAACPAIAPRTIARMIETRAMNFDFMMTLLSVGFERLDTARRSPYKTNGFL